jgi:hypothetical protein
VSWRLFRRPESTEVTDMPVQPEPQEQPVARPEVAQPPVEVQPEPAQPEVAQPQADAGPQVPAGTQVSAAADAPRISQDVEGKPVNILLDPVTGAPIEEPGTQ